MQKIRIALCQINTIVGAFDQNIIRVLNMVKEARGMDADVILFPELALCGYPPEDLLLRRDFLHASRSALEDIVMGSEGVTIIIGFPDFVDNRVFNAAALISDKRLSYIYHKLELPNYGVFDEKRYFTSGHKGVTFNVAGIRIMLTICEDIWVENKEISREIRASSPDITLNISGSPFHAGKLKQRYKIVADFAKRSNTYVCYNNLIGGQDELVFDGGSFVADPAGNIVAKARRFEEDILLYDFDPAEKRVHDRNLRDIIRNSKELLCTGTVERVGEKRQISRGPVRDFEIIEEIYQALMLGTRDYVSKNGFKRVVIGISGGIDSTVTLAIAVDALGNENVIGVTMPSEYTSGETLSDAGQVAENLGIGLIRIPIKEIFLAYLKLLEKPFQMINHIKASMPPGIEQENLQARIRGNILMALSNKYGWLVLTTGNKSEIAVGYCTLYGDMAGGFAVIKDCPKTMVYALADFINKRAGRDLIPKSIIDRPPTAELKPGQRDDDTLPPYPILDPILNAYVEENRSPEDIALQIPKELIKNVIYMVDKNEYKRRQAPPGIKITPRAFGRDRRLPITNWYFLDQG